MSTYSASKAVALPQSAEEARHSQERRCRSRVLSGQRNRGIRQRRLVGFGCRACGGRIWVTGANA